MTLVFLIEIIDFSDSPMIFTGGGANNNCPKESDTDRLAAWTIRVVTAPLSESVNFTPPPQMSTTKTGGECASQ